MLSVNYNNTSITRNAKVRIIYYGERGLVFSLSLSLSLPLYVTRDFQTNTLNWWIRFEKVKSFHIK